VTPKTNKAITRHVLGKDQVAVSDFQKDFKQIKPSNLPSGRKSSSPKKRHLKVDSPDTQLSPTPITLSRPVSPSRNINPSKHRSDSPLRPPNFYNVRLSNAPIFLRRTTLRPASLNFLNRNPPSRSSSPVPPRYF